MCQWQFICQETLPWKYCLSVSTATHIYMPGDDYRCMEHPLPATNNTYIINKDCLDDSLSAPSLCNRTKEHCLSTSTHICVDDSTPARWHPSICNTKRTCRHAHRMQCFRITKLRNPPPPPPPTTTGPPAQSQISTYYFMISWAQLVTQVFVACLCDSFGALINSLVCWFFSQRVMSWFLKSCHL